MRIAVIAVWLLAALAVHAQTPPAFPPHNVPASFFGTVVDDPYRALEDVSQPEVAAWAKSQAQYARSQIESIPGYEALRRRVAELDDSTPAVVSEVRRLPGGEIFFLRRGERENTFKLYRRDRAGNETRLADPDDWQKRTGRPHAINYYEPSHDGRLVAFGISAAGSEDASIYVMETATRRLIGEPIDRAQYPRISWRPDSRSFFYQRQQKLEPGMPATQKYQNSRVWLHTVGTTEAQDVLVAGPGVSARMPVRATDFTAVFVIPGSRHAVAVVAAGVQREISLYSAPLESVAKPDTPWIRICGFEDKVTWSAPYGEDIYLMTYRDSARFSIVRTRLAAPDLSSAETIVPASSRVLTRVVAARDALYVEAREGTVKRLMRRPWRSATTSDVALPVEGSLWTLGARPDVDGLLALLAAWIRGREIYAIDAAGKATNTRLQPLGPFDAPSGLVAREVQVKSHDGAPVPLSIIHRSDVKLDGSNPTLLYAYGAYGFTEEPWFNPSSLAWLERGGVYAVANVRGSSVHGYDWYKAGYKATKPNTWKDLIAAAEYLIGEKYTTSARLGILGRSAGGITVGRAMTERPDLFGAVIPAVGVLDAVRMWMRCAWRRPRTAFRTSRSSAPWRRRTSSARSSP